jgi:hypothetical protein
MSAKLIVVPAIVGLFSAFGSWFAGAETLAIFVTGVLLGSATILVQGALEGRRSRWAGQK